MLVRATWVISLCLACVSARAEDGDPKEQVSPATPAQREWAGKLAAGLGLELRRVDAVKQPGRAERAVEGTATEVRFERVAVRRIRFESAADAKDWATWTGKDQHISPTDPRWVSHVAPVWSDSSEPLQMVVLRRLEELLGEAWPVGQEPPVDLGARLGPEVGAEESRKTETVRRVVEASYPAWEATRAELAGLTVERRTCAGAAVADVVFGYHIDAAKDRRTVCDLRGAELVVIRGAFADDPKAAARALDLVWKSGAAPGSRDSVGVLTPAKVEGQIDEMSGVVFHAGGSNLYQAGANALRAARKGDKDEQLEGDIRWKFLDPGVRNHVLVRRKTGLFFEARVTSASMFMVMGTSEAGHKREKEYLLALLAALSVELPAANAGMVELVEEGK